jgi:hypothetical protein
VCGRYTLTAPADELVEVFDVRELTFGGWSPRYNVAPTQDAPVIVRGRTGERRMGLMRWGLVPAWADDPSIGGPTSALKSSLNVPCVCARCCVRKPIRRTRAGALHRRARRRAVGDRLLAVELAALQDVAVDVRRHRRTGRAFPRVRHGLVHLAPAEEHASAFLGMP